MKKNIVYVLIILLSAGLYLTGLYGITRSTQPIKKIDLVSEQEKQPVFGEHPFYIPKHGNLVKNFGYALEAGLTCKDLQMRQDTEQKIIDEIGTYTKTGIYQSDFLQGVQKALEDEKIDILCQEAWDKFGCFGTEESNLLQGYNQVCAY